MVKVYVETAVKERMMIKLVELYKTDFCDLFRHAEVHFGISWNPANDLFFSSEFLTYKGFHFVCVEESPDEYMECENYWEQAAFITQHFFRANGIPDGTEVLMDCG